MSEYILNISDDTVDILLAIAERIKVPVEIDNIPERLELAIDAMAMSIDTQMDIMASSEGTPLQMQAAVDALLNPNISTTFRAPDTGDAESKSLTWEQICAIYPEYPQDAIDDIRKQAITIVFNELQQDEWASEHAERLIDQTVELLKKNGGTLQKSP